jgi:metal-responsive CopG/Arc/MetJ family transcriptional regulator
MGVLFMATQKVAITMPTELVALIDDISEQKGMSRSRYISKILEEKILKEKELQIKAAYNRVFSDTLILKEQLDTAAWFEGTGSKEGQEW